MGTWVLSYCALALLMLLTHSEPGARHTWTRWLLAVVLSAAWPFVLAYWIVAVGLVVLDDVTSNIPHDEF